MIITLCGSNRFEKWFKAWNEALTLAGHTVLTVAVYPSDKAGGKDWYTKEQKEVLDQVHKDKILISDAILLINVCGYMGESTLAELRYAEKIGRQVYNIHVFVGEATQVSNAVRRSFKLPPYEMNFTWSQLPMNLLNNDPQLVSIANAPTIALFEKYHSGFDQEELQASTSANEQPEYDPINPRHYDIPYCGLQIIDVIRYLNYNRGTAVAYLFRAGKKPENSELQDLRKAQWHITDEVERLEKLEDET